MKRISAMLILFLLLLATGCSMSETWYPSLTDTPVSLTESLTPTVLSPKMTSAGPSFSPTLTPLPVLQQPDAIKAKLSSLLENNGGCQLPCLFGFTPGIATRQDIQNFFNQFSSLDTPEMTASRGDSYRDSTSWAHFFFPYSTNTYLTLGISARYDGDQIEGLGMGSFSQLNTEGYWPLTWNSYYAEIMNYYLFPDILTTYGKPSQILIKTIPNDPQHPDVSFNTIYLVLNYRDQGFLLEYDMERVVEGKMFVGCPTKPFAVDVGVWSPDNEDGFKRRTEPYHLSDYRSVTEATSLSINEFYETFKEQTASCIETPIEFWVNP